VSRMKCSERLSLLSTAGLTELAMLMVVPGTSAQSTPPPPLNLQLPVGFQIPPADRQCILPGQRHILQCIIANDPDAKRVRASRKRDRAVWACGHPVSSSENGFDTGFQNSTT
jgi:hypothetical protein